MERITKQPTLTYLAGFHYAGHLILQGEFISVHSTVQDYKNNTLPIEYQWVGIDYNPEKFEEGVRDGYEDMKK